MSPDIPKFPDFRKITLEDISLFNRLLSGRSPSTSELTFTNFFIWRGCDRSMVTMLNGNLCVVAYPEGEAAYLFEPIGTNMMTETISSCMSYLPRMSRVSEKTVKKYFEGKKGFKIDLDRDNSDYLYNRDDLATLKGKRYDGKRNRIKKFLKNNEPVYSVLEKDHIAGCMDLLKRWKETRKGGVCFDEPIREAIENYEALGLSGAVVMTGGTVKAFTIGEKLNSDTAIIYIEVTDPGLEGIAQYINQRFCSEKWTDVKFINREQDIGDAGLRKAKTSYHPVAMINKYNITIMD